MTLSKARYSGDLFFLENVLSPKGSCESRTDNWPNCFYLRFIPRREIRSISLGVQLILFPFIGVSKSLELFKNP